jgi:DNA topoisomerase-1
VALVQARELFGPTDTEPPPSKGGSGGGREGGKKNAASATAQEAHEAIRPSIMTEGGRFRTPKEMTAGWIADKKKLDLYTLIYERTLASVMKDAKMERKTVGVEARNEGGKEGGAALQAELVLTGQTILTHGFLRALREDQQQQQQAPPSPSGDADNGPPPSLPASSLGLLMPGQPLTCTGTKVLPHSTSPPHRFTQGSFVRTVEELGIGRPSTYATIIEVLKTRRYVFVSFLPSPPPSLPPPLLCDD